MKVELDQEGLICLVAGTDVDHELMEHPLIKINGSYNGSYDEFKWNRSRLRKCSELKLWGIYNIVKNHNQ